MHHLRDSVRHTLAIVLMLGTLAGTVWTFSNGALTLSGAWERLVSVGGVAFALEVGLIYTGWYIGQLDQRIKAARRREFADALARQRAGLIRWFYFVAAISAVANFLFRLQQLGSWPLAAFVSASPIVLVYLLLIVLRPLPDDYQDIGARATGRALVHMVEHSERTILRQLDRMARGRQLGPDDMRNLALAVSITRVYARTDEANALDHALAIAAPVVDATPAGADEWLRSADLVQRYGCSKRTAQAWMARVPGRRHVANSPAWEAPASSVYAVCGSPAAYRQSVQADAVETQAGADVVSSSLIISQSDATLAPA